MPNILNMVYTLHFFSSKCSLFHNSSVFGSCIIHILYTGCAKIKKKKFRRQKVKEGHLDGLQYKHILQNVMVPSVRMPYPDGIIQFPAKPLLHDCRVVQEWLSLQAGVELLTGHRERLIWTPSRICGVRWRGQCRKIGLSSHSELAMSYGPLCQTRGIKLLRPSVTFDHRHELNQWSKHRGSGLFLKETSCWQQPF